MRYCGNCRWWNEEVCCNDKSEHLADFRTEDQTCHEWETKVNENRMCAVCQFCTYEESCKDMVCHNEVAEMFGEALKREDMDAEDCEYFSPHVYNDLSLKEALDIVIGTGEHRHYSFYDAKVQDDEYAFVTYQFDSNEEMVLYCDAHTRLFMEYMKLAEADGDFVDDDDEQEDKE